MCAAVIIDILQLWQSDPSAVAELAQAHGITLHPSAVAEQLNAAGGVAEPEAEPEPEEQVCTEPEPESPSD